MINRVFFILDQQSISGVDLRLPDENVFYSVTADPAESGSLQRAYAIMSDTFLPGLVLTLNLQEPLTAESIQSIASFLFLPSYLRLAGMPVIILTGNSVASAALFEDAAASLSSWLSGQGFEDIFIHTLLPDDNYRSVEEFGSHYEALLQTDPCYGHTIFLHLSSADNLQSALASLRSAESALRQRAPQLCALLQAHGELEEQLNSLKRKYYASALELEHQQQYVDTLRSGHAAREIQDFYTREYEVLPLWYKRFGQVLKVVTGKRTFRSLFRDNTKKYKI